MLKVHVMRKHTLLTLIATTCAGLLAFGNNAKALTLGLSLIHI